MFKNRTAAMLKTIVVKEERDDDGDRQKVMKLRFVIAPFTKDQAAELNVKSRLFDSTTGEPHANLIDGSMAIDAGGLQSVTFYKTNDDEMPQGLVLRNVVVEKPLKYRRDKKLPYLKVTITLVTDGLPVANDVRYLIDNLGTQFHLTFESEQGDLLESEQQAEARPTKLRHPKGKKAKGELRPGVTEEFDDTGADKRAVN